MATIIHLKLNTEEKAMISMAFFLFICEITPTNVDIRINREAKIFIW